MTAAIINQHLRAALETSPPSVASLGAVLGVAFDDRSVEGHVTYHRARKLPAPYTRGEVRENDRDDDIELVMFVDVAQEVSKAEVNAPSGLPNETHDSPRIPPEGAVTERYQLSDIDVTLSFTSLTQRLRLYVVRWYPGGRPAPAHPPPPAPTAGDDPFA